MLNRARNLSALGWLLLVPLFLGCDSDDTHVAFVVRDSSGVTIAESASPVWLEGDGWRVDPQPILDLTRSGDGPEHEFYRVRDAVRLGDGRYAVALPTELRVYSASGVHLATLGQEGEGPGEYLRIGGVARLASDSLAVFDYGLRRVTVYGPDWVVARVLRLPLDYPSIDGFASLAGGFVVKEFAPFTMETAPDRVGLGRIPVPVVLVSGTGELTDTIATAAGYETVVVPREEGFAEYAPLLGRDSHLAAHGDQLVIGDAIELGYTVSRADGRPVLIVRGAKDLSLKADLVEAEIEARYGPTPSPGALRLLADFPRPRRLPAYRALQVDAMASVWLAEHRGRAVFESSRDPNMWEVFDSGGRWLGQVPTPGRFTVLEIGADYVLGVQRDELDVEHVQVLPLHR